MHRGKFILSQFDKYEWWYFTIHIYIFFSYMCIIPKYWYQFWYCVIAVHIHETLSSLIKCFDCFFAPPWTNISNLIILTTWTWKIYTILLPTINCVKVQNKVDYYEILCWKLLPSSSNPWVISCPMTTPIEP